MDEHVWEPLIGWIGRYRCTHCGIFGYKPKVVTGRGTKNFHSTGVVPYQCSRIDCTNPAVAKDVNSKGTKIWVCKEHRIPNQ